MKNLLFIFVFTFSVYGQCPEGFSKILRIFGDDFKEINLIGSSFSIYGNGPFSLPKRYEVLICLADTGNTNLFYTLDRQLEDSFVLVASSSLGYSIKY